MQCAQKRSRHSSLKLLRTRRLQQTHDIPTVRVATTTAHSNATTREIPCGLLYSYTRANAAAAVTVRARMENVPVPCVCVCEFFASVRTLLRVNPCFVHDSAIERNCDVLLSVQCDVVKITLRSTNTQVAHAERQML